MAEEELQSNDGYACSCGEVFKTLDTFRSHLASMGLKAKHGQIPKGEHKSLGRVNLQTGEITLPPWPQRTHKQKAASNRGVRKQKPILTGPISSSSELNKKNYNEELFVEDEDGTEKTEKTDTKTNKNTVRITSDPNNATEIKIVPRIMTMDFTPIMRVAQVVSIREWGWRPDMPLENFLDTVLYNYFKEHGIVLNGYFVTTEEGE